MSALIRDPCTPKPQFFEIHPSKTPRNSGWLADIAISAGYTLGLLVCGLGITAAIMDAVDGAPDWLWAIKLAASLILLVAVFLVTLRAVEFLNYRERRAALGHDILAATTIDLTLAGPSIRCVSASDEHSQAPHFHAPNIGVELSNVLGRKDQQFPSAGSQQNVG